MSRDTKSALQIVNERMEAHNRHDLESFLALYSDAIQVYDYPDTPLGNPGKAHLRDIFEPLFDDKAVHVTIHNQLVNGSFVVNQETVVRRGEAFLYLSIYEVKDGLIKSVRFIRGNDSAST